jgi:hypothetical protein
VTAQSSCLCDVLNGFIIDAKIAPMPTDERSLAMGHIRSPRQYAFIESAPRGGELDPERFKKELIIFDHGYPSFELLRYCEDKHIAYLMRLRSRFNLDIDRMSLGSHLYTLKQGNAKIKLRVIKFIISSGGIETLITNLFDRRMGENAFCKLYFNRWPIETNDLYSRTITSTRPQLLLRS